MPSLIADPTSFANCKSFWLAIQVEAFIQFIWFFPSPLISSVISSWRCQLMDTHCSKLRHATGKAVVLARLAWSVVHCGPEDYPLGHCTVTTAEYLNFPEIFTILSIESLLIPGQGTFRLSAIWQNVQRKLPIYLQLIFSAGISCNSWAFQTSLFSSSNIAICNPHQANSTNYFSMTTVHQF